MDEILSTDEDGSTVRHQQKEFIPMTKMLATVLAGSMVFAGAAFAAPAAKAPAPAKAQAAAMQAKAAGTGHQTPAAKPAKMKFKTKYVGHLKKLPRHGAMKKPAPAHK
jgi:hypothetical protein